MKPRNLRRFGLIGLTTIVVQSSAHATSDIWDGSTDGAWATSTNWATDPALVPGAGEIATFNGAGNGFNVIDLGAGVTVGSIVFDTASAAAYTIGSGAVGSQTLNLGNAGGITVNSGVTANQLFNANLQLSNAAAASTTITNNSSGLLTIAGTVNANVASGNGLLTVAGSGNTTITGAVTKTGAGSNALLKTGAGTLTLSNGSTWTGSGAIGRIPATAAGFPLVAREGTLLLNGGTHSVTGEAVIGGVVADGGAGQNAKIQVDAGSLSVSSWLSIGRGNGVGGVSSDLVLNNAATVSAGNLSAGYDGGSTSNKPKGSVTLNNTSSLTITGNGAFNFAESAGSNFTMTLNGSSQLIANGTAVKYIGQGGTGVVTINDTASVSFGNAITNIGYQAGNGTLNLNGGTFTNTGEVRVGGSVTSGTGPNGSGNFNVSGGTATVGALTVARGNNNQNTLNGTVTVSGGTLTSTGDIILGFAGNNNTATLNVSGGTFNTGTTSAKWLHIGYWDTTKGVINVSSGNLNLNSSSSIKFNRETGTGANVINQTGGNITYYSDNATTVGGSGDLDMMLKGAAGSNNTYNLNGGTLTVPRIISTTNNGTRTFNFNGGTLKAASNQAAFLSLGTGNARANVRNGGALINTNGFNVTIGQALLHSNIGGDAATDGGLTKSGNGTLTLTGANTYNGPTAVNAGSLLVTGSGSLATNGLTVASSATFGGAVTINGAVNSGGNLLPGGAGTAGTLTINNGLTLTGGSLALDLSGTNNATGGGINDLFAITGNVNASGTVIVSPVFSTTPAVNTVYTFGTYTGTLSGGSSFAAGSRAITIDTSTANQLNLTYTGAASGNLNWSSTSSSDWDVVNSLNWYNTGSASTDRYYQADAVTFDNTAGLQTNVALNSIILPGSVVVNSDSSGNNYNFTGSGGIGGTASLTKSGSSTLTIGTSNNFTGATTINGGTLVLNGSLSGTAISVASGATLNESGTGNIGGTSSLAIIGSATLNGNNSYTGGTTVTGGGSVSINSASSLGAASSQLTLDNATLTTTNAGQLANGARVINIGAGGATININSTGTAGTGQLYLSANNTLAGSGALTVTGNGTLGSSGAGNLRITGTNTFNGSITLQSGGSLEVSANSISTSSAITLGNEGELIVNNALNLPNNVTVNGGTNSVISFNGGTTGNLTGTVNLNADATVALRDWWNPATVRGGTISGVISGNGGLTIHSGTGTGGTLTLSGVNTFTGNITANGSSNLTLSGTGQLGSGSYAGNIALNGGTLTYAGTAGQTISGAISGTGGIYASGSGTFVLSGANTFTGKTTINAGGSISAASLNSVTGGSASSSLGAPTSVASGTIDMTGAAGNGTLIYTGTGETTDRVINLAAGANAGLSAIIDQSGTGNLKFTSNLTATGGQTHTLVLRGSTSGTGEIAGAIVDNSGTNKTSVSKQGSGTWTLSGTSSYTGTTSVTAGTLVVNGSISTSITTVSGTGTLGGSGTLGDLTALAGATVSPGNSPGILNAGNTNLDSGSTFLVEINGGTVGTEYDQLNVSGTVALAGLLQVSLGYTPVDGTLFFILANDGNDSITGTFSGLAQDSWFNSGGQWFKIGYDGDSGSNSFNGGNDVVLMAVPEPGAAMLGGLGVLALLHRRRR